MMRLLWLVLFLSACSGGANVPARAPDSNLGSEREKAMIRGQYQAGEASRAWEEARYQLKLAEQEVLNAEDAYRQANADKAARKLRFKEGSNTLDKQDRRERRSAVRAERKTHKR